MLHKFVSRVQVLVLLGLDHDLKLVDDRRMVTRLLALSSLASLLRQNHLVLDFVKLVVESHQLLFQIVVLAFECIDSVFVVSVLGRKLLHLGVLLIRLHHVHGHLVRTDLLLQRVLVLSGHALGRQNAVEVVGSLW